MEYLSRAGCLLRVNRQCYSEIRGLIHELSVRLSSQRNKTNIVDSVAESAIADGKEKGGRYRSTTVVEDPRNGVSTSTRDVQDGLVYRLELWLTPAGTWHVKWTDVPFKARRIDELCITFRNLEQGFISDSENGCLLNVNSMFLERRKGVKPAIGWVLWSVIERYLLVGVHSPVDVGSQNDHEWYRGNDVEYIVGHVVIEIPRHHLYGIELGSRPTDSHGFSISRDLLARKWLDVERCLAKTVPGMLVEAKTTKSNFYLRIGQIRICSNLSATFDLGRTLGRMSLQPPRRIGLPASEEATAHLESNTNSSNNATTDSSSRPSIEQLWLQTTRQKREAAGFHLS